MKLKKYNIAITKPWSSEMYAHNDEVLKEVIEKVKTKWLHAYHDSENEYYIGASDSDDEFQDAPWNHEANTIMQNIQEAVLVTTYGSGFTIHDVHNDVHQELEAIAYWRAKEVAEDLSLLLSKEFIGLG
jgi:predicted RNA-binding protein